MRWTAWWLIPVVAVALGVACSDPDVGPIDEPPGIQGSDGGTGTDGGGTGTDGGPTDGGDGGTGTPDAGPPQPIPFPEAEGWEFFGPQHGGPAQVFGVSSDAAGNIWVAGGRDGLFLLTPGATAFKRFTAVDGLADCSEFGLKETCAVSAVTGGPANTVFVGYHGAGGDDESDPMWMQKTGDADRVVFDGATITVARHYDISSPPGLYAEYPEGREKIRHIHRIVWDAPTGNIWFGGNHGVALYEASRDMVWEHQHATINGYKESAAADPGGSSYVMMSGDWWGVALDPAGDVWIGGAHRVAKLRYAAEGGQFWAMLDPTIDVWPDAKEDDARPEERTDDNVQEIVVDVGGVWIGGMQGLARLSSTGTISYVPAGQMVDPTVTSLEQDPQDGSLWVGHLWGGMTRIQGGTYTHYSWTPFGKPLIDSVIPDIQSDMFNGQRRILVAFSGGAIGIYTGE